jgi:hypothetical protein
MVLPWVTNSIGIYRVEDPESEGTRPVGGPSAAEIIGELNHVFRQACVYFTLAADTSTDIVYDTAPPVPRNGKLDATEVSTQTVLYGSLTNNVLWSGQCRMFLFKRYWRHDVTGQTEQGAPWSMVFTHGLDGELDPADVLHTAAHEMGIS